MTRYSSGMAKAETRPTAADTHRRLLRKWVALVSNPDRKLDEAAHLDISREWANHCESIKGT